MIPGGNTGSVAALTATFATAVTLTGGVSIGPMSGTRLRGLACWRTCHTGKQNLSKTEKKTWNQFHTEKNITQLMAKVLIIC